MFVDEAVDLVVAVADVDTGLGDRLAVVVGVDQLAELVPHGVLVGLAPQLAVLEEHRAEAGVPGAHHVDQAVFLHVNGAVDP
ncbi:hypothetical protein D3C84_1200200 [compost metagenome]